MKPEVADRGLLRVERYDSIHAARTVVEQLQRNGSASQSYSVLRGVERSAWRLACVRSPVDSVKFLSWLSPKGRPFRVYAVRNAYGDPVCVAPLERVSRRGWRVVVGDLVELDYVDFLYAERPVSELSSAFGSLVGQMRRDGMESVTWRYLDERSASVAFIRENGGTVLSSFPNVRIDLAPGTPAHPPALSRNARGHLRNARNRLSKAGRSVSLDFRSAVGIGLPLDSSDGRRLLREARSVYVRRQASRYGHAGALAGFYFRHMNYISLSIPGNVGFVCALRIDGEVAAAMEGYVNLGRGALEVPRISINDDFARFSPGVLLVADTLDWMSKRTNLRSLDLCRGDERYKLNLGGTVYRTLSARLDMDGGA